MSNVGMQLAPDRAELWSLVAAMCDGVLTTGGRDRLEVLLQADEDAKLFCAACMDLHSCLLWKHREVTPNEPGKGVGYILPERPEECFAQNVPDPFSLVRWTREYFSQPGPLSILVATIFIICMVSILNILPAPTYQPSHSNHACNTSANSSTNSPERQPRDEDVDGKLKLVARITGMHNCRWSPDGRAPYSYDHLKIGRELKLDSGLLEITYYNGAKLVLEGPVEFTVEQKNACRLDLGKLTANVSKHAAGFTVETPTSTIVDLGTEFGVVADATGATDVHVFRGAVELCQDCGGGWRKIRIGAGQARRVDAAGRIMASNIPVERRRFVRNLQCGYQEPLGAYAKAVLASKPVAYWRLNELAGNTAFDTSESGTNAGVGGQVRVGCCGPPNQEFPGFEPNNKALSFPGIATIGASCNEYMIARVPELAQIYSIEFWFSNTRPFEERSITGYIFSCWADMENKKTADHFGIGGTYNTTILGKPFVYNGSNIIAGKTTLGLEQWHHVAIVREGDRITVYLNGNVADPEIQATLAPTYPDIPEYLTFGGRADGSWSFEGSIDEVAVYDRLLTTEEVSRHYAAAVGDKQSSRPGWKPGKLNDIAANHCRVSNPAYLTDCSKYRKEDTQH